MVKLVEIGPGRWRIDKPALRGKRSDLPLPNVISDTMDAAEQVDGKFYTSKRAFRAVGRANGLTEVGTEKVPPRVRASAKPDPTRRQTIKTAIEKYGAGHRPGRTS